LGVLPLLAHLIVGGGGSLDPEWCLYIMVLCGTGAVDAMSERGAEGVFHVIVVLLGFLGTAFGALGYAILMSNLQAHAHENRLVLALIVPLLSATSIAYVFYKLPLLWEGARF
jgi:hypothetical protein